VRNKKQYVIDEDGKKISIVLSIDEYDKMIEDIHDLAVVSERRDEEEIEHKSVISKLKKEGLIK